MTVMELLVHHDASERTQQFLNEDFMKDFLWQRYQKKWVELKWPFILRMVLLLLPYVILLSLIASPSLTRIESFKSTVHHSGTIASNYTVAFACEMVLVITLTLIESMEVFLSVRDAEV